MSDFRKEILRNLKILSLISVCFIAGVIAAEAIGALLETPPPSGEAVTAPMQQVSLPAANRDVP
ncbi:MAG: hypothetical protein KDB14_24855 [Planctomycetales bacterium]|nr:hypothetical protein [Planctomycetales bacterium]